MIPSPLPPPPYKRCHEPHNPPPHLFPAFIWVSLAHKLALTGAQVITANTPRHPTASVTPTPQAATSEVPESPSSSPSIHGELPCITVTMRSNSGEFLSSQVHRKSNFSQSLQSLHPVHAISRTKINPNPSKNPKTLH
jgi:hypothetical protein